VEALEYISTICLEPTNKMVVNLILATRKINAGWKVVGKTSGIIRDVEKPFFFIHRKATIESSVGKVDLLTYVLKKRFLASRNFSRKPHFPIIAEVNKCFFLTTPTTNFSVIIKPAKGWVLIRKGFLTTRASFHD
jgi:rRNA processing protein Gar1